jgi:outer membrane receptor protein involved in Fe transport
LNQCHLQNNQDACVLITRSPVDNGVRQVINGALNISEQGANGIDVELKWDREFSFGLLDASILYTRSLERSRVAFPGEQEEDLSGRYTDPTAADGGARPENKANITVGWTHDSGFSLNYLGEFIGEMDADTFCNCGAGNQEDGSYIQKIDSQIYHDIVGSYQVNDSLTISGGITNVTNEEPPFIEVGFNASTDPATYREFGRGYYLRLKWDMQ